MTPRSAAPVTRPAAQIDAAGWLTLYIVVLLFVPSRLVFGPLGSAGAPSMLMGLGSFLLWFLLRLGATKGPPVGSQPIRIALGVFFLSVSVTYVLAMSGPMSPDEISPGDVALLALASWGGTLLIAHDEISSRANLDQLIWRLCVCGALIAMMGLFQFATRRVWVDELSIPGLTGTQGYGLSSRGGFPRPPGFATHPIEFGTLITMLFPITMYAGFNFSSKSFWIRWFPAAMVIALIPLTSSRSAYLGAFVGIAICMFGWTRARRLKIFALAASGLVAMSIVVPNLFNSIVGLFSGAGDDPSVTSRTDSFAVAFEFIARDPWFGRGLGTFLPKYRIFDNQYLLLLVTAGVVGTLTFLALGITAFTAMTRLRRRIKNERDRDLALALAAAVATGFTCLFMFDAFAFPMTMGLLFLILGLAGAHRRLARNPSNDLFLESDAHGR